jgi:FkbM family methyltransferase
MLSLLARLKSRGVHVGTIIDVGASDGRWTSEAMEQFPGAHYLLFEAQPVHFPALDAFASKHKSVHVSKAAASDQAGYVHFDAEDPFGGQVIAGAIDGKVIKVPATTIDEEVTKRELPAPFFVKLDTHGHEVKILEGAKQTLSRACAVLLECYNFRLCDGCLLIHETCSLMEKGGFRLADMADPLWRPKDQMLWQLDMLFLKEGFHAFEDSNYG